MLLVALARVRRTLTWYVVGLAGLLALATLFGREAALDINGQPVVTNGTTVALAALTPLPMFFAAVFATTAGLSLNRENVTLDLAWTKPIPREVLAARYVAVDALAVAVAFALAWVAVVLVLASLRIEPSVDPRFVPVMLLSLGVAEMWYALILALTARLPPSGAAVAGMLWPVAFLTLGLAQLSGAVGALARALAVLDPFAYVSAAELRSVWTLPLDERAAIVWGLAALLSLAAMLLWSRREV